MKRLVLLVIWTVVLIGTQLFVNCSNPLGTNDGNGPLPGPPGETDTLFVYDTLIIEGDTVYTVDTLIVDGDTVFVVDTLIIEGDTVYTVDTLIVTDTLTIVDTVVVVEPGPGESMTVCSIIRANLNQIIWMLRNSEGEYDLKFTATAERDFSFRTMTIDVDGDYLFTWWPSETPEFDCGELLLNENTTIRITTDQPCLLGHEVDICLILTKRE